MDKDFQGSTYYDFKGSNGVISRCVVNIFSDDGEHFICFEDIGEGMSVTNASEILATEIVNKLRLNPGDCRFFETYREYNYDSFDEIEYEWKKEKDTWKAANPRWKPAEEFKDKFYE